MKELEIREKILDLAMIERTGKGLAVTPESRSAVFDLSKHTKPVFQRR